MTNLKAKPGLKIKGSITQRQPNGDLIGIEFHGDVDVVYSPLPPPYDMKAVAEVVVEAEMNGNAGKSRIHLFLE